MPTSERTWIWLKVYGKEINIKNVKLLLKNEEILNENLTFHTDVSSVEALRFDAMIVSSKKIKHILNHDEVVLDDGLNEEKKDINEEMQKITLPITAVTNSSSSSKLFVSSSIFG